MKKASFFLLALLTIACNTEDHKEQLKHLNGYWEIDQVQFSKDSIRDFSISEHIDYFEIADGSGFRKKVTPQFDGSYKVNPKTSEEVKAVIEDGELTLYYSTPFDSWKEQVLKASDKKLSLKNNRGIIYNYNRYTPLLKDDNEKEE